MVSRYVPDSGDIVWLQFDPQAGHEQAGHRPALVISPARYNQVRGMMICCPMTSRIKGYPFEVVVSEEPPSAVLADQVKSLDWRARKALHKGKAPPAVLAEVQAKIQALLGL
jgi:mRNA interferase MazF